MLSKTVRSSVSGKAALTALKELTQDLHAKLDTTSTVASIMQDPTNREAYDAYLKAMLQMQYEIQRWEVDQSFPFSEFVSFFVKALEQDVPIMNVETLDVSNQKLNYMETLGAFYVLSGSMHGVSYLKKRLRYQIVRKSWPHTFLDDATSVNPMKALHQFREHITRMNFDEPDINEMYLGATKVFNSALKAFQH